MPNTSAKSTAQTIRRLFVLLPSSSRYWCTKYNLCVLSTQRYATFHMHCNRRHFTKRAEPNETAHKKRICLFESLISAIIRYQRAMHSALRHYGTYRLALRPFRINVISSGSASLVLGRSHICNFVCSFLSFLLLFLFEMAFSIRQCLCYGQAMVYDFNVSDNFTSFSFIYFSAKQKWFRTTAANTYIRSLHFTRNINSVTIAYFSECMAICMSLFTHVHVSEK